MHAKNDKPAVALKYYKQALQHVPNFVPAMVAAGAAYTTLGQYAEAIKNLEGALDIDPDHENARHYLDFTLSQVGIVIARS